MKYYKVKVIKTFTYEKECYISAKNKTEAKEKAKNYNWDDGSFPLILLKESDSKIERIFEIK